VSDVLEILRVAGPWGGPVLVFGYLYARGHLATGRELQQAKVECERERIERERERAELRKELTFWRDIAWRSSSIADQVVGALTPHKDRE